MPAATSGAGGRSRRPHIRPAVVFIVAAGASLVAGGTACGRRRATAAGGRDTLYVGVAAARTNTTYFEGVELALARLNRQRPEGAPVLAIRMPLEVQTSQVKVAEAFRDDPTVIGVVGHTGSAQTLDAAPIYGDREHDGRDAVVAVSPTATNPAVTRASDWIFRVCPTDDDAARQLARFALDSVHARTVAILYRNDLFGRGFTRVLAPELQRGGATVVERDPYLAGVTEYQAYAARMAARKIDALVVAGGGADAADMIRALRRAGADPAVLGTDDVSSILSTAAGGAERDEFRGVRFTAFYDPARASSPDQASFAAEYEKRYGAPPNQQVALSYDAAMVIGRAVHEVGGDRRRVRDWIASLGNGRPAHHGLTGDIRFDRNGDAVAKQVVIGEVAR